MPQIGSPETPLVACALQALTVHPLATFKFFADYFKICGEHCVCISDTFKWFDWNVLYNNYYRYCINTYFTSIHLGSESHHMNGSTIKDLHAWQKCNLSLGFVILFNWDLFCIYICLLFIDSHH